jgi:hypothetical protein
MVKHLGIQLTQLDNPVKVLNVDESKNAAGMVDFFATLTMKLGTKTRSLRFYMAELGKDCAIFGFPLRAFNPTIDWRTGKIRHHKRIMLLQKQKGVITVK